jgi:hypothetical protein
MTASFVLIVGLVGHAACGQQRDAMTLSRCWECEDMTDRPVVVLLHGSSVPVGRLTLCASCVATHYAPLAADPELASLVSIHDELEPTC